VGIITKKLRQISSDPAKAKKYWQAFHARNNQNISKHLLAHGALLVVSIRERKLKELATQTWLFSAVIPVHTLRMLNGFDENSS
jgi:hypothetical protein